MDSHHNAHYRRLEGAQASGGIPTSDGTHQIGHDMEPTVIGDGRYPNATSLYHWTRKRQDPIQRLPSELATLIIYETLQADSAYPTRLIELTNVSQTWQRFLCSIAILWSQLYIDEREPDLLVTLAVFIHLSGTVPLRCVIFHIQDWTGVKSLLLSVRQRITVLTIRSHTLNNHLWLTHPSLPVVSAFFDHLGRLPHVIDVIFDDDLFHCTPGQLKSLNLSPNVRFTSSFTYSSMETGPRIQSGSGNRRFFDMVAYDHLGATPIIFPTSASLTLSMQTAPKFNCWMKVISGFTLHHLEYMTEFFANLGGLEPLIRATAFGLFQLSVEIPLSQIADLVDCLRQLMNLQELGLRIIIDQVKDKRSISPSINAYVGLRSLQIDLTQPLASGSFSTDSYPKAIQDTFGGLSAAFQRMYPAIKVFDWHSWCSVDLWHAFSSPYLQSLGGIESLKLNQPAINDTFSRDPIILCSLQDLSISHNGRWVETPNLLRLEAGDMDGLREIAKLDTPRLRKLIIRGVDATFDFNELHFPELRELDMEIYGRRVPLIETRLFPLLISINLTLTASFTNPLGTLLCLEILYHPDHFRFLQQLRFNPCVEWDVLFLMLERRNFGITGAARIHTVDLPFVPIGLHDSLALLLAGERTERPSLMSLSVEETRQAIFDATVPGCFFCLRNMAPHCEAAVLHVDSQADRSSTWDSTDLYPEFEVSNDTLPTEIRGWMEQRRYLVSLWWSSYESFRLSFRRVDICRRFSKPTGLWTDSWQS